MSSLAGLTSISAQSAPPAPPVPAPPALPDITPEEAKAISSYLFGFRNGQQLSHAGLEAGDLYSDSVTKGFLEGLKGGQPAYPQEKLQAAMQYVGTKVQERQAKEAEENIVKGKDFLEKNGKREGVTTTESGLQYEVIKKGTDEKFESKSPELDARASLMVNYRGTLIDGTEFDKNDPGQPVPMNVSRVIPGFQEALKIITVGSKMKFFLPPNLAYGSNPAGPIIKANSTLIFELELIEIKYPEPLPEPKPSAAPPVKPKATAVTPPVPVPAPPKPDAKKEKAE